MGCQTKPIIGYRFVCLACNGLSLCKRIIFSHLGSCFLSLLTQLTAQQTGQKCFFLRKAPRNHKPTHSMDIIIDTNTYDKFKWCILLFSARPLVNVFNALSTVLSVPFSPSNHWCTNAHHVITMTCANVATTRIFLHQPPTPPTSLPTSSKRSVSLQLTQKIEIKFAHYGLIIWQCCVQSSPIVVGDIKNTNKRVGWCRQEARVAPGQWK